MATIQSSIQLMDGMTRPLNSIINSINLTISSLQRVNNTNVNLNTSELLSAQAQIQSAGAQIRKIEEDIAKSVSSNANAQNNFNNSMRAGVNVADNLYSKVKKMVGAYAGYKTFMGGINLSDTIAQNTARLTLLLDSKKNNNGTSTINNVVNNIDNSLSTNMTEQITNTTMNNNSTNILENNQREIFNNSLDLKELQNMIFESSKRSRGNYFSTVDSIGKMGLTAGDAFNSNSELISFMELINKQFKISGTSAAGIDAAMLQLTQAMGAGVLRGEELNSVFEQAPLIIKNIASYLNVPIGQIKNMAAEGKITSDIVKNAMFYAANDINKQFESIPKTFNDIMVNVKNNFFKQYEPISQRLSNLANSKQFTIFTDAIVLGMVKVIDYTVAGMDIISKIGNTIISNWNSIGPLIGAVTMATIAYKSNVIMTNLALMKNNFLQGQNVLGAITLAGKNFYLAASTFAYTVAQEGLNAALRACPITWIIGGIAAVIGVIYGVVAAYNAFTNSSISATGIITGGIGMIVATVINMGLTIWNILITVAEFFVNVWLHPIYSVKKLFADFILDLIDKLMFLAKIADKVLGKDFQSKLSNLQTSIETNLEVTKPQDYIDSNLRKEYVDVFGMGKSAYDLGANFTKGFGGIDSVGMNMEDTNKYLAEISKNTANTSDGLDLTAEEIKYMRDLAEMEVINRFTTASVNVNVGGITNQVNNEMDLDTVVSGVTDRMREAVDNMAAEGVYD